MIFHVSQICAADVEEFGQRMGGALRMVVKVVIASETTNTCANICAQDLKAPKVSATALNRSKHKSRRLNGKPKSALTLNML